MEVGELLRSVQTCADSILPTLTPSSQSRGQSDIQTLIASLADLESQMDETLTASEKCLALWNQYDTERDVFTSWMTVQSQRLETEPQKQTSLDDMKTALDIQQVRCALLICYCAGQSIAESNGLLSVHLSFHLSVCLSVPSPCILKVTHEGAIPNTVSVRFVPSL